jgi:dCMP deaminase
MTKTSRLDWDNYFLAIAELTSKRSACLSRQVGCVITDSSHHILATGYNNPPFGIEHCQGECPRKKLNYESGTHIELCPSIHGEQNAILSCAHTGTRIEQATLYCTHFPCSICTKMILNLDITAIYFIHPYPDKLSIKLLKEKKFILVKTTKYSYYTKRHNNESYYL